MKCDSQTWPGVVGVGEERNYKSTFAEVAASVALGTLKGRVDAIIDDGHVEVLHPRLIGCVKHRVILKVDAEHQWFFFEC